MPIISGGSAASAASSSILFTSTLGANAATIDTGALGVATTLSVIEIQAVLRTTEAAVVSTARLTFNNDSGANYDRQSIAGQGASATAGTNRAASFCQFLCPGATATAGEAGAASIFVPFYAATTFMKQGNVFNAMGDDAADANNVAAGFSFHWRNTAAISRVTLTAGSGVFLAGSSMVIFGR